MPGVDRINSLKIADFNRVAESDQAINLSNDGTVIAKSSFASKVAAFFKPEKARRDNQQATASFVASITRTLTQGSQSGIFSKVGALSPDQKEAIVANLLNFRDASGKGILDDQLKGAKPLTGRKVAQVIALVNQSVSKQLNAAELDAVKGELDGLVSAANDLQPQADRLRFGKLKLSDDGKKIAGDVSKLVKDLSASVDKLKRAQINLYKQVKQAEGPDKAELQEQLNELDEFIKSGELSIRDLQPNTTERNQETHVLASSIGYLSKKEPLPEGSAIKSILHKEKRIDKGDSRVEGQAKSTRVGFTDHLDIGVVPGSGDEVEHDARLSVEFNENEGRQTVEIRKDLRKDGSISAAEVEDLLVQARLADGNAVDESTKL
jgi:hypothetical protein